MTLGLLIGIGLLGGAGAVLRLLGDGFVSSRVPGTFPLGTLTVNLTGTFALGLLIGSGVAEDGLRILGLGLLGGFTTFSTWMYETQRLADKGSRGFAGLNLLAGVGFGLLAIWLGIELGGAL
jgi:CrcB protein